MPWCCPPGHGCNAPDSGEPCALELLRVAAAEHENAAAALSRWSVLERACGRRRSDGERRFRRRAFARLRDQALIGIAMRRQATHEPTDPIVVRRLDHELSEHRP